MLSGNSWNPAERIFGSCPERIDAGDLVSVDGVGKRPGANAVNIAAGIDQTAGCLDRQFGAWIPDNAIVRVLPILHMPRHGAGGSEQS